LVGGNDGDESGVFHFKELSLDFKLIKIQSAPIYQSSEIIPRNFLSKSLLTSFSTLKNKILTI